MVHSPIARRVFVGSLAAGVAVAAAALWRWPRFLLPLGDVPQTPPELFVRQLRDLLPPDARHEDAMNAAAQALRLHGARWSDVPSALEHIGERSMEDALASIRRACRDDYEAGRTVPVIGWLVSRTEAELITLLR